MNPRLLAIRRILKSLDLLGGGAYHHTRIIEDHCCETFYSVQLRYAIEDVYDIYIDWEDFARLVTIGDLIAYIELHLTNQPSKMNPLKWLTSWFKPAPTPAIDRLSAPPSLLAHEIAETAKAEVGVHETNGSNCGPRVNQYKAATNLPPKQAWPWCAAFVCWCVREAATGRGIKFALPTTAGAWAFEDWARKQPTSAVSFKKPHASDIRKGDILVYTFSHIGIAMGPPVAGLVPTCEGNTDGSGSRDGGEVAIRTRSLSTIRSRIRITG